MFQERYFVPKSTDTYADCLMAWGLAEVLQQVLKDADVPRANRVTVIDEGTHFVVQLPQPLQREWVEQSPKPYRTYFIGNQKITTSDGPFDRVIDMDAQWEKRKRFSEMQKAGLEKSEDPNHKEQLESTRPHEKFNLFATAKTLSGDAPSNEIWKLFHAASWLDLLNELLNHFAALPSNHKFRGKTNSTATLLNPSQGQGTNDPTPKGASGEKMKEAWQIEWLRNVGYYSSTFCASFQNAKGTTSGIDVVVLHPRNISLRNHWIVRDEFAKHFYAGSVLKFECLAALRYANAFLLYAEQPEGAGHQGKKVSNVVSGFGLSHFMDVRQGVNFVVKRITFIAMPTWITIADDGNTEPMRNAVTEHIRTLNPLEEKRGESRALLEDYLNWSSSGELKFFWAFTSGYGIYRMMCATKSDERQPVALTTTNLGVILMSQSVNNKLLAPILRDEHFQNVARAIRKSTINALYQKKDLPSGVEIHYGLAQELRRLAPYKEKFTARLLQHLQTYNEENVRASTRKVNEGKEFGRRANITTRDIERLIELIDDYEAETMCGLLLAYGYAKDPREDKDPPSAPNNEGSDNKGSDNPAS